MSQKKLKELYAYLGVHQLLWCTIVFFIFHVRWGKQYKKNLPEKNNVCASITWEPQAIHRKAVFYEFEEFQQVSSVQMNTIRCINVEHSANNLISM